MELKNYCWKIYKDTMLYSYYAVIDKQFSLSNFLCIKYRIKAKFIKRYDKPDSDYAVYIVRVRKKDQIDFELVMHEFPEIMRKAKHYDYEKFCMDLQNDLNRVNLKHYAFR